MANRLTITVDDKEIINRVFRKLDRIGDLSNVWDSVRDTFHEIEAEQFRSGGAAGESGKWAELSKKYEIQKINRYGTYALLAGVLHATGALYESMTRMTENTIYRKSKDEMVVGSDLPYAVYHQRGGKHLPKREIISLTQRQKKRIGKTITKGIARELRKGAVYVQTDIRDI